MPLIRYTLQVIGEDDTFSETDYFPGTPEKPANEVIRQEIVIPLNVYREKHSEPPLGLVKAEVLNPYVHLHSWKALKWDRYALKVPYRCQRCGAEGYKKLNLFTGEYGGLYLYPPWDKRKFELCKDPLKELPKTLTF
jgi:hypothetical protein